MKRILIFLSYYLLTGVLYSQENPIDSLINFESQKFRFILEKAYTSHKDSVNIKKMSEKAFSSMLQELDPYSLYFNADQYKFMTDSYTGSTVGVGLNLYALNDTNTVILVVEGSPADSVGMMAGDKLLFIDGVNVAKMPVNEVYQKLAGAEGTKVSIIFRRGSGSLLQELILTRNKFYVNSVTTSFIVPGTDLGYIKIGIFSEKSDLEFVEAAKALRKKGMKQMLLDLRGNTGGYLDQVVKMCDELLKEGFKIAYTSAKIPEYIKQFTTSKGQEFETIPIIVMIDGQSASASEILSGAVQDLDRGLVIGAPSQGKGLVQRFWEFKDGSAFRLTVADYYTPSGRNIQKPYHINKQELDPALMLNSNVDKDKIIDKIMKTTGGASQLPIYKSLKGRDLLGGGGIYPDYFVKEDTTTLLTEVLKGRGVFLEFCLNFLQKEGKDTRKKYNNDFSLFLKNFQIDDNMLTSFIEFFKSKNLWNEQMLATDREYIRNFIKATLSYVLWGDKGFYAVMLLKEKSLQKAIELVPEAEKFSKLY